MSARKKQMLPAAGLLFLTAVLSLLLTLSAFAAADTSYRDVDTSVDAAARAKYTKKKGAGNDKVTIMVYMIGSDLESRSGMATTDLNEMLYAQLDNKRINYFVQTGGTKRWRNSVMKAGKVQRWRMDSRGLELQDTLKSQAMTSPEVLADFIRYCAAEAPADRYMLIFWDHGAGSVSGYGHDENYPNDTMDIGEISRALKSGGVKFDMVGFDTCLMATLETAIAIEPYADYMLASEESEPGTGWYYTNWLKVLDNNTSVNTLSLGKQIIDDFTEASARVARGAQTTLSLVDLAELKGTVLKDLGAFGVELTGTLKSKDFQSVATARQGTREFAPSSRLDQADLVDFCTRLGTAQAGKLAASIQSAVKYNRVSNITNAYGLSIYFPKSSLRSVNSMIRLYESIGMDDSWSDSVKTYATLESSGQIAASSGSSYGSSSGSLLDILLGGMTGSDSYGYDPYGTQSSGSGGSFSGSSGSSSSGSSLLDLLFGDSGTVETYDSYNSMSEEDLYNMLYGGSGAYASGGSGSGWGSSYGSTYGTSYGSSQGDLLSQLLGGYTTTSGESYGGLDYSSLLGGYGAYGDSSSGGYSDFYGSGSYSDSTDSLLGLAAQMLFGRAFVGSETLELSEKDGQQVMVLDEDRWEQVTDVELNVFADDGGGFLDLGLDNVAEYNDDGDLIDAWDGTWLTLQGQPCAVYPISDEDEDGNGLYITRKFIPALLNGERVNLIAEFNEETGEDRILGAQSVYDDGEVGKGYAEMNGGDVLTLVCDYYGYDGVFRAQYTLGDPLIVPEDGELTVANMEIAGGEDDRLLFTYRLTDLYQAHYWLPVTEKA